MANCPGPESARRGPSDALVADMDDAAYAVNVVGGVLLGAALAAIVLLLVPIGAAQPLVAFALAALCLVGVHVVEARRGAGVAEAGLAAALVCAASIPFYVETPAPLGALSALVAVWITLVRRGASPLTLLAVPAYFAGARHATGADMLRGARVLPEIAFMLALAGLAILLAGGRRARWPSYALAAQGLAIALATFPLLDALGVTDAGLAALAVSTVLGALFGVGVHLGERPLVATTGCVLAFAACAFAFLALGPALAALVLLCMGAALVWQAENLRGYFRQPTP